MIGTEDDLPVDCSKVSIYRVDLHVCALQHLAVI